MMLLMILFLITILHIKPIHILMSLVLIPCADSVKRGEILSHRSHCNFEGKRELPGQFSDIPRSKL